MPDVIFKQKQERLLMLNLVLEVLLAGISAIFTYLWAITMLISMGLKPK